MKLYTRYHLKTTHYYQETLITHPSTLHTLLLTTSLFIAIKTIRLLSTGEAKMSISLDEIHALKKEDDTDFQDFLLKSKWVHYIGMISPPTPGIPQCLELLENRHYPPNTKQNDNFIIRIINRDGVIWSLTSIPAQDKTLMEQIAHENSLHVENDIPTLISPVDLSLFPEDTTHIFTLATIPMVH